VSSAADNDFKFGAKLNTFEPHAVIGGSCYLHSK